MAGMYQVLSVKRLYRKNFQTHFLRQRYYQVTFNGAPGHNVITLPWWCFRGVPARGVQIEFIWDGNVYNHLQWKIHRQKTK